MFIESPLQFSGEFNELARIILFRCLEGDALPDPYQVGIMSRNTESLS